MMKYVYNDGLLKKVPWKLLFSNLQKIQTKIIGVKRMLLREEALLKVGSDQLYL